MRVVVIGADNQVAIHATKNKTWASSQHMVDRFHNQVEVIHHRHTGIKIELRWTLGHEGIPENKHVDAEVKRAEQGE